MSNFPVDLYYEEMGQGTPFLFVHGFPLDHATWLPVARLLKTKTWCILPDTRGLGKSPVTGTEATIEEMAADEIRLMDKLHIEKAIVTGHSMGGYIAMQMARSFPDRICGLGLVATRDDPDTPEKAAARLESREDVLKNGTAAFIKTMASRLTNQEEILPEILGVMGKTSPEGIAMAQFAIVHRHDAGSWLKDLSYPVVVVAGGRDMMITEDVMQSLSRRLKDGRYYSNPTASHMIPMEEPGLIARALEETYLTIC